MRGHRHAAAGSTLPVLLIDCGSASAPALGGLLRDSGARVDELALEQANGASFQDCGAVVISGGPHLYTGPGGESLRQRFAFIERLAVPALGICLGHQALGLAAGARVFRGAERRCTELISRVADHELLDGLPETLPLTADHCEGIDLPPGFRCLAGSRYYDNEIMVQPERALVGIQAHPESSAAAGRRLLDNFLKLALARWTAR